MSVGAVLVSAGLVAGLVLVVSGAPRLRRPRRAIGSHRAFHLHRAHRRGHLAERLVAERVAAGIPQIDEHGERIRLARQIRHRFCRFDPYRAQVAIEAARDGADDRTFRGRKITSGC